MARHVTLYVRQGCPHCDATRQALLDGGCTFTEIDVGRHPEVVPELLKLTKGRRLVPVVVDGGRIDLPAEGAGSAF